MSSDPYTIFLQDQLKSALIEIDTLKKAIAASASVANATVPPVIVPPTTVPETTAKEQVTLPLPRCNATVKKQELFVTQDNGGSPFSVILYPGDYVEVYANNVEPYDIEDVKTSGRLIMKTTIKKFWRGDDVFKAMGSREYFGGAVLFQVTDGSYIHVGTDVKEFSHLPQGDTILYYVPEGGRNAVTYPYAVGSKFVYFLHDNVYIPAGVLTDWCDVCPIDYYYCRGDKSGAKHLDCDEIESTSL